MSRRAAMLVGLAVALDAGASLPNERGTRFYHKSLTSKAKKKKRDRRKHRKQGRKAARGR